ncbi:MAG: hypothetical protein RhofKO_37740 [Rhodothermales bacterium]
MVKLIVLLVLLYLTYQVVREALGLKQKRQGYFQRVYRDLQRQQPPQSPGWSQRQQATPTRDAKEVEDASWEDVT